MTKRDIIIAIWVFIALSASFCWAEGPRLSAEISEYDFGDIPYGKKETKDFWVKNTGDQPLEITKVRTSCGCTKAKIEDLMILPKEGTILHISFDTKGLSPGKQSKTVYINSTDPQRRIYAIKVHANVVRKIAISPNVLVARLDKFQERVTVKMQVSNSSNQEIKLKTSKIRGMLKNAQLSPKEVTVKPGEQKEISALLTLEEKEKARYYKGDILLDTNYPLESGIVVSAFITVKKP